MCGRFSQHYTWQQIHNFSNPLTLAAGRGNLQQRYNIAPTTNVDIIVPSEAGRELISARWWLVPAWWKKSLKEVPSTFNARVETVDTSPMFRDAFRRKRCIVPASGFFEWTGPKTDRIPHYFSAADDGLLGIAGLWERWQSPEGEDVTSCTMVVRDADEWTARYHDRMLSFLQPEDFDAWLSGSAGKDLLRKTPPKLQEWVVDKRVNKTGQGDDEPATIERDS
ncbi:Putative SOS response-associated peptidase YedK [Bosea sp. OK403]|uniref:SOS response-associated peptidase n=1 Tax=Bosea sp. OK403 TaxID=1855286 RepID=UPI0008F0499F|nr:SOS response-associated peptidase [Bosea sp. OK403]SFI43557.1 Putative SOS response-associated peptidase YedK [Bosea sp. OK403]